MEQKIGWEQIGEWHAEKEPQVGLRVSLMGLATWIARPPASFTVLFFFMNRGTEAKNKTRKIKIKTGSISPIIEVCGGVFWLAVPWKAQSELRLISSPPVSYYTVSFCAWFLGIFPLKYHLLYRCCVFFFFFILHNNNIKCQVPCRWDGEKKRGKWMSNGKGSKFPEIKADWHRHRERTELSPLCQFTAWMVLCKSWVYTHRLPPLGGTHNMKRFFTVCVFM